MNSKLNQLAKTCIFAVVGGLVTSAVLYQGAFWFIMSSFYFGAPTPRQKLFELIGGGLLMPGGLLFGQLKESLGQDQALWIIAFIQACFWSVVWWIVLWINRSEEHQSA
jgi:hypothetical protein